MGVKYQPSSTDVRSIARAISVVLDYIEDPDWGDEIADVIVECATDLPQTRVDRATRLIEDLSEEGVYLSLEAVLSVVEGVRVRTR